MFYAQLIFIILSVSLNSVFFVCLSVIIRIITFHVTKHVRPPCINVIDKQLYGSNSLV